jgi:hypothetical protein
MHIPSVVLPPPHHYLCWLQAQRLEELQESLAVPYDGQNLQHQQQLQELWGLAFPQLPFPAAIKSNQWKEMGWQVGQGAVSGNTRRRTRVSPA